MSRFDGALHFPCPMCKAKRDEPCTYMTEPSVRRNYGQPPREQSHRIGDPTKRPHGERLRRLWAEEKRQAAAAYYAQASFDPLADVRRAEADFMKREHEQLRVWLRRYGMILWLT